MERLYTKPNTKPNTNYKQLPEPDIIQNLLASVIYSLGISATLPRVFVLKV